MNRIKGILGIFETFNSKFPLNSDVWSVKRKGISGISGTFTFFIDCQSIHLITEFQ
jgi:hypothetical protein